MPNLFPKGFNVVSLTLLYSSSEAGNQLKNTGFPRFEHGAGSIKPGMTIKVNGGEGKVRRIDHGFGDTFLSFLMIFGMKKEKTKRPTEKKTLKESN
jgi:hypothetical protein